MIKPHFYAFAYASGRNTTTETRELRPKIHIAGALVRFDTATERDSYVSSWDGGLKEAVATRDLPMGWSVSDATDADMIPGAL